MRTIALLPNKFYSPPSLHKFDFLMYSHSSNIIQSLALFTFNAFKKQNDFLKQDSKNNLNWCAVFVYLTRKGT